MRLKSTLSIHIETIDKDLSILYYYEFWFFLLFLIFHILVILCSICLPLYGLFLLHSVLWVYQCCKWQDFITEYYLWKNTIVLFKCIYIHITFNISYFLYPFIGQLTWVVSIMCLLKIDCSEHGSANIFSRYGLFHLDKYKRNRVAELYNNPIFNLLRNLHMFFIVAIPVYIPTKMYKCFD